MDEWDVKTQLEIAHQARVASQVRNVQPTPGHILEKFRKCKHWWASPKELMFKALGPLGEKEILDFGCGTGEISNELALLGAKVTGIDISPQLIEVAKRRVDINGVRDRVEFIAGDVTKFPFRKGQFDAVVCFAVLHHVDLRAVLPILVGSLRPGGKMVIVEPIAFSPVLGSVKKMLPTKRDGSPVDRQLNADECRFIAACFEDCEVSYYDLFGRLARLFPWKSVFLFLGAIDHALVTVLPFVKRFCGEVAIIGHKPQS